MATCTPKQNDAIRKFLSGMNKNTAYVVIFDLLDANEQTAFFQVRYNDVSRSAIDFKQWSVGLDTFSDHDKVYSEVQKFVGNIIGQLLFDLHESQVVVKAVVMTIDGSID